MAYIWTLKIIMAKKTTGLVLLFHKNITKLIFLWLNMGQTGFKVLINEILYIVKLKITDARIYAIKKIDVNFIG